jgi:hypothetical protein
MSHVMLRLVVVAALGLPAVSAAQEVQVSKPSYGRGQGWSAHSGATVGQGATALTADVGWPGLSLGVLYGAGARFDLGARFTFNYGFEGMVRHVAPGIKLQGVARLMLLETSKINLGLEFAPGPLFYFDAPRDNRFYYREMIGLTLPISVNLGIPVGSAIMLNAGLDMPMFVIFGQSGGLVFPVLFGGGLEYFIDRSLAVTFNVKMGPSFFTYYYSRAEFTLETLLGIAYKF